jgi:spore coat protein U-like protein
VAGPALRVQVRAPRAGRPAAGSRHDHLPGLLGYNLWSDLARSGVWGNGSAGTVIVSGTLKVGPGEGNGTRSAVHYIYGRIPALQDAQEGDYVDSIVATLTY